MKTNHSQQAKRIQKKTVMEMTKSIICVYSQKNPDVNSVFVLNYSKLWTRLANRFVCLSRFDYFTAFDQWL